MQQRLPCASELTSDCPYQRYEPQTLQGWQTWDIGLRTQTLSDALQLASCLGYDTAVIAELFPAIPAALHAAMNDTTHGNP